MALGEGDLGRSTPRVTACFSVLAPSTLEKQSNERQRVETAA